MAITQVGTGTGNAAQTSAACTPTGTRAAGDIVVVFGFQRVTATALSVAATGLTFTQVVAPSGNATYGSMGVWWARYSGTGNPAITVTGASTANLSIGVIAVVLRGADTSASPLTNVGSITNQAAAAAFTVTGPTGVAAGSVMIGCGASLDNNDTTGAWSGSGTELANVGNVITAGNDASMRLTAELVASGAAGNFTYTQTTLGNDAGRTLIFGVLEGESAAAATAAGDLTLTGSVAPAAAATAAGSLTLTGSVAGASAALATLVDTFTGTSGLWTLADGAAVTAGVLRLTPTITAGAYWPPATATSVDRYNLIGSQIVMEVVAPPGTPVVESEMSLMVQDDADNYVSHYLWKDTTTAVLAAERRVGGTTTQVATIAEFNATTHRWWKITEAGGVVRWWTSPDGSTWTELGTGWTHTIDLTAAQVVVLVGGERSPGSVDVDNVNSAPTGTPASAAGALTLSGAVTARAVAAATGSLTLSGTAVAQGRTPSITGSLTLTGTGTARGVAGATGLITLGGTATAADGSQPASAAGSLTLSGQVTARAAATVTGSLTLTGTAATIYGGTIGGALTLSGQVTAVARVVSAGSLSLSGAVGGAGRATAAGSLSLSGAATARAVSGATGTLTLSGTGVARAPAEAVGVLTLAGVLPGTATPGGITGSLTLTATATAGSGAVAAGELTLGGSLSAGGVMAHTYEDTVGVTDTLTIGMGVQAAGSVTLGGSVGAVGRAGAAGAITLTGSATGVSGALAAGTITLGGQAGSRVSGGATGSLALTGTVTASPGGAITGGLTLAGVAAARPVVTAAGSITLGATVAAYPLVGVTGGLNLSGEVTVTPVVTAAGSLTLTGLVVWSPPGSADGTLTLSGTVVARPLGRRPPRVGALLVTLLADVGAVRVWVTGSTPTVRGVAEATTVQVDVRASSKKAARDRAYEARGLVLALPGSAWDAGTVLNVDDVQGPGWSPDTDGAPRYVFRCTVTYRTTRIPSLT